MQQNNIIKVPLLNQQKLEYKNSRRQVINTNYDPSAFPPDLELSKQHGKAQKVGQYISPSEDVERCKCCFQPINKKELGFSCQLSQFSHIGVCYPLYFYFIKLCLVLIFVSTMLITVPSIIINLTKGTMCKQLDGFLSQFYSFVCNCSVINIMNVQQIDMLQVEASFNFAATLISIPLIAYLSILMENKYVQLSKGLKASDFSIILKGLPKDITIYQIQKFVEDKLVYLGAEDNTVIKIYIIYDLKTVFSLYAKKRQLVDQLPKLESAQRAYMRQARSIANLQKKARILTKSQNVLQEIGQLQNKIEMIEIQINNYEQSFKMLAELLRDQNILQGGLKNYQLKFSGKCIVTLENLSSRKVLIDDRRKTGFLQNLGYKIGQILGGKRGTLVISEAPQPADMIIANMGSKIFTRWKNQIMVTIIIFTLIALDFFLLTLSKKLIKQEKAINSQNIIFSFINSQLIALFNSILGRVIRIFENNSVHIMQSSYYYSVTSKLVFLFLINMLITTFFSNVVSFYLIKQDSATFQIFPLNFEGFLFDVFFLIVTNPFVTFFLMIFDHRQGYKLYKRYRIERGLVVTQAEANLDYENMPIDISNKYGNIYRFVMFSAGIACVYPLAFPICFLTLVGFYWIDKILLLRRYVPPFKLGYRTSSKMQKIMMVFPVLFSTMNLIIMFIPVGDGQAFQNGKYSKAYYYLAVIGFLISLVFYLIGSQPLKRLLQCLFKVKRNIPSQSQQNKNVHYSQIQNQLIQDYWHHYPYFKVRKNKQSGNVSQVSDSEDSLSPRKSKIDQLNRKMTLNVFSVIQDYLNHRRYAPNV